MPPRPAPSSPAAESGRPRSVRAAGCAVQASARQARAVSGADSTSAGGAGTPAAVAGLWARSLEHLRRLNVGRDAPEIVDDIESLDDIGPLDDMEDDIESVIADEPVDPDEPELSLPPQAARPNASVAASVTVVVMRFMRDLLIDVLVVHGRKWFVAHYRSDGSVVDEIICSTTVYPFSAR